MLPSFGLVAFLFLTLLVIQKQTTRSMYLLFFLVTKSRSVAIHLYALLMLPGTIFHELSHWLVAEILQVPTGKFDYMPRSEGNSIRMGSIQIGNVDPFRRTVIGLAPVITGVILLIVITSFFPTLGSSYSPISAQLFLNLLYTVSIRNLALLYLVFTISNTMFSSKKDLEAAIVPVVFLSCIVFVWWKLDWMGYELIIKDFTPLFEKLNTVLAFVCMCNLFIIICTKAVTLISERLLHRHIVSK